MSSIETFRKFVFYHERTFHTIEDIREYNGKLCLVYKDANNEDVCVPIKSPCIKLEEEIVSSLKEATVSI